MAEHRNFTAAAATLPVSQSGLSQQIRRLESLLGVSLFERTTREVRLSEVGAEIAGAVRGHVGSEDELLERVRTWRERDDATQVLTVYIMENGVGHLLLGIVERARHLIPGLRVEVEQVALSEQSDVLTATLEPAVLIGRPPFSSVLDDARRTRLADDPLCLVVPADHAVGETITVVDAVALERRSLTWLPDEWRRWTPLFGETARHPSDVMVANNFKNAIESVGIDDRPVVAPCSIARSYVLGSEARTVEIVDGPVGSIELVSMSGGQIIDRFHAAATLDGAHRAHDTLAIQ